MKAGAGPIGARLFQADFWTSARITRVHSDLCHGSSRHCSAVELGPLPSPSGNGNASLMNTKANKTAKQVRLSLLPLTSDRARTPCRQLDRFDCRRTLTLSAELAVSVSQRFARQLAFPDISEPLCMSPAATARVSVCLSHCAHCVACSRYHAGMCRDTKHEATTRCTRPIAYYNLPRGK